MASSADVLAFLCRSGYYISLLGLKIPLGLLVNASRARWVLAFVLLAWVPFLAYCHAVLLPKVQGFTGAVAWHLLTALWVTIPLLVVGVVILSKARTPALFGVFMGALTCVVGFHKLAVPALVDTQLGAVLLHSLFAFFEDMPIGIWIWCLVHVVRLQAHIDRRQAGRPSPFALGEGAKDGALIVGNAPTVTDGKPLGAIIDDFEDVVRFNSYSVDQPDYTGSRVGFHFCNGRNFPTSSSVKAVCPLFNASLTHAVYLFMPHAEEAREIFASLTSSKVDAWFVGEAEILSLRRKIGCRLWQIPTSGMVAVDGFLAKRESVTLHGFNFFQSKKIHYFSESPTQLITSWLERFVTHEPLREKRWVEGLVREGRVAFLTPFSGVGTEPPAAEVTKLGEKKKDGEPRRRPGLMQTLLKDGLPSQFSL
uniref:Uncharacterized protein n=1 Tax=Alexandrium catenella TaxID=2925 RepID=A0A7S1LS67_ALECA|mmetsp:Transcript_118245/g.314670  ORF Transcript_118245/g.314670 Transcript_118245/m.314670 type:complete len:423 (+) Transcript_118245:76-1344(+)